MTRFSGRFSQLNDTKRVDIFVTDLPFCDLHCEKYILCNAYCRVNLTTRIIEKFCKFASKYTAEKEV